MDHVASAQTPETQLFFLHFQDSKADWHTALDIEGPTLRVIGKTSLCQGDLYGVEVIVGP